VSETTTPMDRPTFGPQGEPCSHCGSLLARDQRYCLECGTRRAGMSAMLAETAEPRPVMRETERAVPLAPAESPWRLDAGLLAGVGCLLLALLVGVLIGHNGAGDDNSKATTPQVVTVAQPTATAGGGAAPSTPVAFKSDWPEGKRGFTVQLQTLPKDGTDAAAVAAAKQAATGKGATGVGALDSDAFSTLDPGQYVIYAGEYADKKAAKKALGGLRKSFPDATVVEVGTAAQKTSSSGGSDDNDAATKAKAPSKAEQAAGSKAIQDIENATGKDYSKKSAKLPKTLVTPGTPPPKDNKPAGGGSETETFK
jgi:hypothetical protein